MYVQIDVIVNGYDVSKETELLTLRGSLERKAQIISKLDEEILDEIDDDGIEAEIEQAELIHRAIQHKLIEIDKILKPNSSGGSNTSSGNSSSGDSSSSPSSGGGSSVAQVGSQLRNMKLPKYEISFNGDPKKYRAFRDLFEVAVKNRTDMTDVERFMYLLSFLEGDAERAVEGLEVTGDNFKEAMQILEGRFGNKQLIVNSHMEEIVQVEAVTEADDPKCLRAFYDKVEVQLRSLRTLGVDPETHGMLLIPIMKGKLPEEINLLLCRKFDSNVDLWKIADLMKELKSEIEARERSRTDDSGSKKKKQPKHPPSVGSLLATGKLTCPYCDKGHFPDKCRVVTDPARRKQILIEKGRCFICTKGGHSSTNGCQAKRNCMNCGGKHHTSICLAGRDNGRQRNEGGGGGAGANAGGNAGANAGGNAGANGGGNNGGGGGNENPRQLVATIGGHDETKVPPPAVKEGIVLLQTACAEILRPKLESTVIIHPPKSIKCRIILDNGSHCTYVTRRLQRELRLGICGHDWQDVGGFGGNSAGYQRYDVVMVAIKGKTETICLRSLVVETICTPLVGQNIDATRKKYPHLQSLDLADKGSGEAVEVEMLIGSDNYWHIVSTTGAVEGKEGPVALSTKLGYVLSGPAKSVTFITKSQPAVQTMACMAALSSPDELKTSLQKFWNLDSIGLTEDDTEVQMMTPNTIRFEAGRYVVNSPWKAEHDLMGDNFVLAKRRLLSNLRRFKRDNPELLQAYMDIFKEQRENGILEEVTSDMIAPVGRTYYMPHQMVVREDKETTKKRVVYDCSSKMNGNASLNDCLEVPEPLYADLLGVLVSFRCHAVAMSGDIEKAFLRIGMEENDRDAYRVLFVDDPFADDPKIVTLRFTTVTFGVGPSMWHLGAVVKHHVAKYEKQEPEVVKSIERALYADDFNGGASNDEKGVNLYKRTKQIFKDADMNMRKWRCNSEEVMKVIREDEGDRTEENDSNSESQAQMMLNPTDDSPHKVLGVPWDIKKDVLKVSFEKAVKKAQSSEKTKKNLLSAGAMIFDPIGAAAPVTFAVKVFYQELCKDGGSWDEPMKDSLRKEWEKWLKSAERCSVIEFPRCYDFDISASSNTMLVGFCDASEKGYAAVVYIRVVVQGNESVRKVSDETKVSTSLVSAKTRVAPLTKQTIPRLELLGALILAQLLSRIRGILQNVVRIDDEICLTDSTVALHWIQDVSKPQKRKKKYVEKRVEKIRTLVHPDKYRHVAGKDNIADLPSRGCTPEELQKQRDRWFYSSSFVRKPISEWEVKHSSELQLTEDMQKAMEDELVKNVKKATCLSKENWSLEKVFEPQRYSSCTKLYRITSLCLKFIDKCRKKENVTDEVTAEDMCRAKDLWVRHLQKCVQQESKYPKMAESLGIEADDKGYLRCRGRLGRGKMPFDTKHPLILPTNHWVTELIIRECHENVYHDGVKETLAELRSMYWITKGRQKVKSVLRKCHLCKLLEGLSYPAPVTSDLPEFRLHGGKAFRAVGVDFCGPVYVKEGKEVKKAYIVLFTCATSRMVHLELCPDLTTEAYIRSQKRMMGRKGTPAMFVSDNGRTFKGKALKRFNAAKNIRWRYNLSRAPWWGGLYERLIKSTKRCLKKAIGSRCVSYEELETVLIEVEAVLNSRPLTYLYETDTEVALTPSHLFCGRRLLDKEDISEDLIDVDATISKDDMLKQAESGEKLVEHFWNRWHREYLLDLREYQKIHKPKVEPRVTKGDVVLIQEDGVKRNKWKLGKIENIITGEDGVVRGAEVKTCSGKVSRPLQRLYPLEVTDDSEDGKTKINGVSIPIDPKTPSDLENPPVQTPQIPQTPTDTPVSDGATESVNSAGTIVVSAVDDVSASTTTTTTAPRRSRRRAAVDGEDRRRRVERS
jgi:hypothetical protein